MRGCDHERWLLRRYQDQRDIAARDELVRRMAPLVRRAVHGCDGDGRDEDLWQVAALGLLRAIDRYDRTLGVGLAAYALPLMRYELWRFLQEQGGGVRIGRRQRRDLRLIAATRDDLVARRGREPDRREIARAAGLSLDAVLDALGAGAAQRVLSLDAPLAGEGVITLADVVGAPDDRLEAIEWASLLGSLWDLLDAREQRVLRLRFDEGLTQREIGCRLGLSQMQVSRVLRGALARLQEQVAVV